ncbi:MAG: NupC/NupG family nucleoside CNT transporter [Phycisphaera sp.]|nr:MAG: NupC/NupG family nucleoside CNT transporter [Phycisphaera sp.]
MDLARGLLGILVFLAIAFAFSTSKRAVKPRIIIAGIALQLVIAFLLIRFKPIVVVYEYFAGLVTKLLSFSQEGASFMFGDLVDPSQSWGFIFVVQVLPTIVFFASVMSILYHLGIMQRVVAGLAAILKTVIGVSGSEALAAAANVFVGQTEAPLCIKPYLPTMTRSQIMLVMTCGFSTIAGSVLAAYVGMLGGDDPDSQLEFAKHLLTASAMSAPGAFVMAKILLPETEEQADEFEMANTVGQERTTVNVLDAAAAGATDGLKLALNVAAMLVAFVALIALVDWPLAALSDTRLGNMLESWLGLDELSLIGILGLAFSPVAALIGIERGDIRQIGEVLGTSMVVTEFLAYDSLRELIQGNEISAKSAAITTYALCGFANFPSIAIQIGGLTAIAPERRSDFSRIGLRAMFGGALTCWMTGCIASIFI